WSQINLSYEDASNLNKAFENIDLNKQVILEDGRKVDFFEAYPSYFFWIKNSTEGAKFQKNNLGQVWGMIPDEFRGKDKWSKITLSYEDASNLNKAFEGIKLKDKLDGDRAQFFKDYQSYFFWIKNSKEGKKFQKNHLGHVWGMIPDEFKNEWSKITLSYEDASNLNKAFEKIDLKKKVRLEDGREFDFFEAYPSYFFWIKQSEEGKTFQKNHLGHVWGMIPEEFRKVWSKIDLSYQDASNLNKAFEGIKLKDKLEEEKDQFFAAYQSYFFWFKDAPKAEDLKKNNLGHVWDMIPDEFREEWSTINLSYEEAETIHDQILVDAITWQIDDNKAHMKLYLDTNLNFAFYWALIPSDLREKYNLEYYSPGKVVYNRIHIDSKQEFAVLRVFEEVLGYQPEEGVNFQVQVDENTKHTFDFKIDYQVDGQDAVYFFEWHPVVVSFNGGRNDAFSLGNYDTLLEMYMEEGQSKSTLKYAQDLCEQKYHDDRWELLTNETANNYSGNLKCATSHNHKKNLKTLYDFLKELKPELEMSFDNLRTMFGGYLKEALAYE
ncbi:hypothetical protein HOH51_03115, partial [bacterium]|nr:hypothetical protein [bacterium]